MDASAAGNYMAATSGFAIFFFKDKKQKNQASLSSTPKILRRGEEIYF
jgi:hypothetical protein